MAPRPWQRLAQVLLSCSILPGRAQPPNGPPQNAPQEPPPPGMQAGPLDCPREPFEAPRSEYKSNTKIKVSFKNVAGSEVQVFALNDRGGEEWVRDLTDGQEAHLDAREGELFHFRSKKTRKLIDGFLAQLPPAPPTTLINPCVGLEDHYEFNEARWPEFEKLVVPWEDCSSATTQDTWSCRRLVSHEEVRGRDKTQFGFAANEVLDQGCPHKEFDTQNHGHTQQVEYMPNVTEFDGGYLKMKMTDGIKEVVRFYHEQQQHVYKHMPTPGFVTNNHVVDMDMLNIPFELKLQIVEEMRHVLEWWTKSRMKHTTTYDIRIYRRGSMLINHIDRKDTHLASAILNVHQVCDKDFGWPLEVIHPHVKGVTEVFLQPGEMLLYEGARLPHGRPMRSQCQEFSNVFTHFVPVDFHAPNEKWRNPYLNEKWVPSMSKPGSRDEL